MLINFISFVLILFFGIPFLYTNFISDKINNNSLFSYKKSI